MNYQSFGLSPLNYEPQEKFKSSNRNVKSSEGSQGYQTIQYRTP